MNQQEEKRVLDIAITAGRQPRHVASVRTVVAAGQGEGRKKYLVLANGSKLTRAGQYWYDKTGQPTPIAHFDRNQATVLKGDGDSIKNRSGLQRERQIEPGGHFKLTASGKVKAGVAGKRHRLISHNAKYIRQNRGTKVMSASDSKTIKSYLPYGL